MPEQVHGLGVPGMLAVLAGFIIFYGSVYLVVGLNTGWRFGYWLTFSGLGALMVFIAAFWLANPVGPRGEDPIWFPIATSKQPIENASFGGKTYESTASYPGAPWHKVSEKSAGGGAVGFVRDIVGRRRDYADPLFLEIDPFKSAVTTCLGFDEKKSDKQLEEIEKKLNGWERTILEGKFRKRERLERMLEVCRRVYAALPTAESLPLVAGLPVPVTYDVTDIRFNTDGGTLLGEAIVKPNTYDKRYTGDQSGNTAKPVGDELHVLAYKDRGSLRYPSYVYLLFWSAFLAFHLWGLARAEHKKLSPVAV